MTLDEYEESLRRGENAASTATATTDTDGGESGSDLFARLFGGDGNGGDESASKPGEYGAIRANGVQMKPEDFSGMGERGGVESALLNIQRDTGIESDYDGTWGGGLKNALYATGHAGAGRAFAGAMNKNLQFLAKGTDADGVPLEQLPDNEVDYLMDSAGANGAGGWFRRFLGAGASGAWRGEDNIMRRWDETDGAKIEDPAERKRARIEYAREIARGMIGQTETSKQRAAAELEGREETTAGAALRGLIEQGGYTLPFIAGSMLGGTPGSFLLAGGLEGADRYNELRADRLAMDADGNIGVEAAGDEVSDAAGKALLRGIMSPTIEMVGGKAASALGGKLLGATIGKVPLFRKAGNALAATKAGRAVDAFAKRLNFLGRYTGMQGMPEEMAEELEDQVLDAAFGIDRRESEKREGETWTDRAGESFSDFFKGENLKELATSMLLMQVIGGAGGHVADRIRSRHIDGVLREVAGVDASELKYYTADEKMAAFKAWAEGLTEDEIARNFDEGAKQVNRMVSEIRRNVGENQFAETDADAPKFNAPMRTNGDGQTLADENGNPIPDFQEVTDEAGRPVMRLYDAESGITIDRIDMGDGDVQFRVTDAAGRVRAAETYQQAVERANQMLSGEYLSGAKRQYLESLTRPGRMLSGMDIVAGDSLRDVVDEIGERYGEEAAASMRRRIGNPDEDTSGQSFRYVLPDGRSGVAFVLGKIGSVEDMATAAMHEAGRHAGLDMLFDTPQKKADFLKKIDGKGIDTGAAARAMTPEQRRSFEGELSDIQRRYGLASRDDVFKTPEAVEELFAYFTENEFGNASLKNRFVAGLRSLYRDMFDADLSYNDADLLAMAGELNRRMRENTEAGRMTYRSAQTRLGREEAGDIENRRQGRRTLREQERQRANAPAQIPYNPTAPEGTTVPRLGYDPAQTSYGPIQTPYPQSWRNQRNPGQAWGDIVRNAPDLSPEQREAEARRQAEADRLAQGHDIDPETGGEGQLEDTEMPSGQTYLPNSPSRIRREVERQRRYAQRQLEQFVDNRDEFNRPVQRTDEERRLAQEARERRIMDKYPHLWMKMSELMPDAEDEDILIACTRALREDAMNGTPGRAESDALVSYALERLENGEDLTDAEVRGIEERGFTGQMLVDEFGYRKRGDRWVYTGEYLADRRRQAQGGAQRPQNGTDILSQMRGGQRGRQAAENSPRSAGTETGATEPQNGAEAPQGGISRQNGAQGQETTNETGNGTAEAPAQSEQGAAGTAGTETAGQVAGTAQGAEAQTAGVVKPKMRRGQNLRGYSYEDYGAHPDNGGTGDQMGAALLRFARDNGGLLKMPPNGVADPFADWIAGFLDGNARKNRRGDYIALFGMRPRNGTNDALTENMPSDLQAYVENMIEREGPEAVVNWFLETRRNYAEWAANKRNAAREEKAVSRERDEEAAAYTDEELARRASERDAASEAEAEEDAAIERQEEEWDRAEREAIEAEAREADERARREQAAPDFALESATPEQLKRERNRQAQREEIRRRQEAELRGSAGETGQTLLDLGGAEGEDLFNRTQRQTGQGGAQGGINAPKRLYTKEGVTFKTPIVGKTGAKVTGYVWPNKGFEYTDKNGNDRVKRISDWDFGETSEDTGRQIIHQFTVEMSDGSLRTVSAESAAKLLGISVGEVKGDALRQIRYATAIASMPEVQKAAFERKSKASGFLKPDDSVALMNDGNLRILGWRGKEDGVTDRWHWQVTTITPNGNIKTNRLATEPKTKGFKLDSSDILSGNVAAPTARERLASVYAEWADGEALPAWADRLTDAEAKEYADLIDAALNVEGDDGGRAYRAVTDFEKRHEAGNPAQTRETAPASAQVETQATETSDGADAVQATESAENAIWTDLNGRRTEMDGFASPSKGNVVKGAVVAIKNDRNTMLYEGEVISVGPKNVKILSRGGMGGDAELTFPRKDIVGVKRQSADVAPQTTSSTDARSVSARSAAMQSPSAFKRGDTVMLRNADGQYGAVTFVKDNGDGTATVQRRTANRVPYLPAKVENLTVRTGDLAASGMKRTLTEAERDAERRGRAEDKANGMDVGEANIRWRRGDSKLDNLRRLMSGKGSAEVRWRRAIPELQKAGMYLGTMSEHKARMRTQAFPDGSDEKEGAESVVIRVGDRVVKYRDARNWTQRDADKIQWHNELFGDRTPYDVRGLSADDSWSGNYRPPRIVLEQPYVEIREGGGAEARRRLVEYLRRRFGAENVTVKGDPASERMEIDAGPYHISDLKDLNVGIDERTGDYAVWDANIEKRKGADAGGGADVRWRRSGIFTGTEADYANESRQGGKDDGPSLHHVGTGEGSQVYGWGLYGSTERGVAETYAHDDSLRKTGLAQDPGYDMPDNGFPQWAIDSAREKLRKHGWNKNSRDKAISEVSADIDKHKSLGHDKFAEGLGIVKDILEKSTWHDAIIPKGYGTNNYIYEQTFFSDRAPGDESHLLKWYEPVTSEQKQWIADELNKSIDDAKMKWVVTENGLTRNNPYAIEEKFKTGQEAYQFATIQAAVLAKSKNGREYPKLASEFLARAGIDGVKYPVDSYGGKGVKDGDKAGWNYVSFRDDNIQVDHKWRDGQLLWRRTYTPNATARTAADNGTMTQREQDEINSVMPPGGRGSTSRDRQERAAREQASRDAFARAFHNAGTWQRVGMLLDKNTRRDAWRAVKESAIRKMQDAGLDLRKYEVRRFERQFGKPMSRWTNAEKEQFVSQSTYYAMDRAYGRKENLSLKLNQDYVRPLEKQIAENGLDEPWTDERGEQNIGADGKPLSKLDVYLMALHGGEYNRMIAERTARAEGGPVLDGSGRSTEYWERQLTRFRNEGFDRKAAEAVRLVHEMNKAALQQMVDSGRISQKQADKWNELSPNYVPLRNSDAAHDLFEQLLFGGDIDEQTYRKAFSGTEYNHAAGRRSLADSPVINSIQQAEWAIARSMDNESRRSLAAQVRADPRMGTVVMQMSQSDFQEAQRQIAVFTQMEANGTITPAQRDRLARLKQNVADTIAGNRLLPRRRMLNQNSEVQSVIDVQGLEDDPNVGWVAFKENGDTKYIKLGHHELVDANGNATGNMDELTGNRIAKFVNGQSFVKLGGVMRFVRNLSRGFGMLRTSLSPTFLFSNFLADNGQALRNVFHTLGAGAMRTFEGHAMDMGKNGARASALRYLRGQLDPNRYAIDRFTKEWAEAGGQIGGFATESFGDIDERMAASLRRMQRRLSRGKGGWADALKDGARALGERFQELNSAIEMATRISAYATMRENGMGVNDAVSYARDVTVNFNRKGEWTPIFNALYVFSNANIQDMQRTGMTFTGSRAAKLNGTLFVLGLLSAALGFGQDEPDDEAEGKDTWENASEHRKQNGISFRVGGKVISLPLRGLARMPYYAGHKAFEALTGRRDAKDVAADIGSFMFSAAAEPLSTTSSLAQSVAPSILRPAVELIENKSFTGAPIHRTKMSETQVASEMGRQSTSGMAVWLARTLNSLTGGNRNRPGLVDVFPETLEQIGRGLAGTLGTDLMKGVTLAKDIATFQTPATRDVPFVSRVASDMEKNSRRYHEAVTDFERDQKEYKDLAQEDPSVMAALRRNSPWFREGNETWYNELDSLRKLNKKLMVEETKADGKEREALNELRMKTQGLFLWRLKHAPESDAPAKRAEYGQRNRLIDRMLRGRAAARKREERTAKR